MKKDKEPNVWWTALKLIIGATVLIGGTGLLLKYVAQEQGPPERPAASDGGWGISNDSPIRR